MTNLNSFYDFPNMGPPPLEVSYEPEMRLMRTTPVLDRHRYVTLLHEDLGFTPETLGLLDVSFGLWRRPGYDTDHSQIRLKPERKHCDTHRAEKMNDWLMFGSKMAQDDLILDRQLSRREWAAVIGKDAVYLSTAILVGTVSHEPGLGKDEAMAFAAGLLARLLASHAWNEHLDSVKKRARAFKDDPEARERWRGLISMVPNPAAQSK